MLRHALILIAFFISSCYIGYGQLAQISTITPSSIIANTPTDITIRGINTHFQKGVTIAKVNGVIYHFSVANTVTGTLTLPGMKTTGIDTLVITSPRDIPVSSTINIFSAPVTALTADILILPMETISLKDIDLSNPKATPVLFMTNIYNNDTPRWVNISIAISSLTKNVLLGEISKSNYHLGYDTTANLTNQNYDAVKTNGSTAGTPGYDFLQTVELTGVFPPDNYMYLLTVTDIKTRQTVTSTSTTIITNTLTNPSLITPGAEFSNDTPVEYNPLPLFQWFGQNDRYDFALYECLPGQNPQEVVRNVAVFKQTDVSGNSFLYPNSAEKLIDGMTYAWQVQGKVVSATSTHYLPSEVFQFTYRNPTSAGVTLVSSIVITPSELTMPSGQQQQFTVICYDKNGAIIPDAKPVWSVTPSYGSISQTGLFTAGQGGNTVAVLVSAGTATDFAPVMISLNVGSGGFQNPYSNFMKKIFGLQ